MATYKKIPLTQGKFALVDAEDYEWLMQWKWQYHLSSGYVVRTDSNKKFIAMHSLIMNTPSGKHTDHINRNKLDNRKSNLRVVSPSQNKMNQKIRSDSRSKLKGVFYKKDGSRVKKWGASIKADGKRIYGGIFFTKQEAAIAYNEMAIKYFGEFANLNRI